MIAKGLERLFSFVFPFLCPGCHQVVQNQGFCPACWSQLEILHFPLCQLCGQPLGDPSLKVCAQCRAHLPLFNSHRALWAYGPLSRKVIFSFKHGRQRYLARWFAQWLLPRVLSVSVDGIVPVPLHPKRLAKKGFNPAACLAVELGKMTGLPVFITLLERLIPTPSQGGLSLYQRQVNVQGAFSCAPLCQGSSLILVDDVYTTGATLNACVDALRQAGVAQVHALTLAKVT